MASPVLVKRAAVDKRQFVNERSLNKRLKPPFIFVHAALEKGQLKMKNSNRQRGAGFTLVEIMIVVAIIALLAAIAIPNFVKARTASQKSACIANLKQIDGAKATWALEAKKQTTDTPVDTDLFGTTSYIRAKPGCPANGTYTLDVVSTPPSCSLGT